MNVQPDAALAIGLVAQDLADVTALSIDADPTEILAQRARERRRHR